MVYLITFILSVVPTGEMRMNLQVTGDYGANTKTVLLKLQNVKASEIEPFVRSRLTKFGSVQVNDPMNMLIITDYQPKLSDLVNFVKQIDEMGTKGFLRLKTETIPLNYLTPSSLIEALKERLSPDGSIQANDELGVLIVTDVDSKIEDISNVVSILDTPPKQVLLRGRIVEISEEKARKLGLDIFQIISKFSMGVSYSEYFYHGKTDQRAQGNIFLSDLGEIEQNEKKRTARNGKEFSILLLNNHQGELSLNDKVYLNTVAHIGYKGDIQLDISIKRMYLQMIRAPEEKVYPKNIYLYSPNNIFYSKDLSSTVRVANGDTLIISGLKTTERVKKESGIPILKSIPIPGYLFKRETTSDITKDLIVILYPKIVESKREEEK